MRKLSKRRKSATAVCSLSDWLQSTIGKAVEQKLILTLCRKCTLYPDLYLSNADKQFLEMKCCSGETFKGKFITKILAAKKFSWISYTLTII